MSATSRNDLDAILDTIREVEVNLERRGERAGGAVNMVWGVVVASIFAFYHFVAANPAPFVDAFGLFLPWVWVGPCAFGYALTVAIGARLGRVGASKHGVRFLLLSLIPLIVLIAVLSALGDEGRFIPALTVAFLAWMCLGGTWREVGPQATRYRAVGIASLFAAGALLVPALGPWVSLLAALWYGVILTGVGAVQYHAASRAARVDM